MARKRLISPQFFRHADLWRLERDTGLPCRLAFVGLWCQADRRGYFAWKPEELKLEILPYDAVDMSSTMLALCSAGFLRVFERDDRLFGVIVNFGRWQSFNMKERPDRHIPEPLTPESVSSTVPERYRHRVSIAGTGTGTGTNYQLPSSRCATARATRVRRGPVATWLTPAQEAWEAVYGAGSFPVGQAARELGPLYAKGEGLSPEAIGRRLAFYLRQKGLEGEPTKEQLARTSFRPSLRDFRLRHGAFDPDAPAGDA